MIKLRKNTTRNQRVAEKEVGSSVFIPYLCHWNSETILTKKKELLQVIKIDGFSFETADDSDVDIRKNIRNALLKGMASGSFGIYFHTVRRRQSVFLKKAPAIDPSIKIPKNFATYVEQEWRKKHQAQEAFVNELYITVIRKPDTTGAAIIEHLLRKIRQQANKSAWEKDMVEMYEELTEITGRIVTSLRDYGDRKSVV